MPKNVSKTTTDHDTIRSWAEERGGWPAEVESTGPGGQTGVIRVDFPGFSGEGNLRRIGWDEWFEKFDRSGLALVYEDLTAAGQRSNFNELVSRETAAGRARGGRTSARSRAGARSSSRAGGARAPSSKRTARKAGRARAGATAKATRAGARKAKGGEAARTAARGGRGGSRKAGAGKRGSAANARKGRGRTARRSRR